MTADVLVFVDEYPTESSEKTRPVFFDLGLFGFGLFGFGLLGFYAVFFCEFVPLVDGLFHHVCEQFLEFFTVTQVRIA